MAKDLLYKLFKKSESIGLLCNQSGWHPQTTQYSFQWLASSGKLKKVFIPEHGLFGELQDQVKLDDTSVYRKMAPGVDWISLYGNNESHFTPPEKALKAIDTLVIDLQDTGSRYYTFTSTAWLLLKKITELGLDLKVVVIDKPNPAGRQVEGTRISAAYSSFIGMEGLPHRHGLTLGELCLYFRSKLAAKWELVINPVDVEEYTFIAPSPNIPSTHTCKVYSGQCLWEGTNISEGRGTTLPFEIFGAPFLDWVFEEDWNRSSHPGYSNGCVTRAIRFIPVFHKFSGQTCSGLHLMPRGNKSYHSLDHTLRMMHYIREKTEDFAWRPGPYEAFNERKAIELLAGDPTLLDYLEGKAKWNEVKDKLDSEENDWIREVREFRIYKPSPVKLKIKK